MPALAWGVDSAAKVSIETLRAQQASFILCYLAPYPSQAWKIRTPAEWRAYLGAGFQIIANWESSGGPENGRVSGVADARTAQAELNDRGCSDAVVYFSAADADPNTMDLAAVADYHRGNVDVLGYDRVGVYGGYGAIKYLADLNICKFYFQTYAWSNGQWDSRAQLRQWKNTQTIDYDEAWTVDFGQYPRPAGPVPPVIPPNPVPAPVPAPVDDPSQYPDSVKIELLRQQIVQNWDNPNGVVEPGHGWPTALVCNIHKIVSGFQTDLDKITTTYTAIQASYEAIQRAYEATQIDVAKIKKALNVDVSPPIPPRP